MHTRNLNPVTYIHYGTEHFDPDTFKTPVNRPNWIKPMCHTGLWASPKNAEWGWKDWCETEHYDSDLSKSFEFTVKDPSKIIFLTNMADYKELIRKYGIRNKYGCDLFTPFLLDYEKMISDGWDGLEISITDCQELYDYLYGWDCDSILIFSKDAIKEVTDLDEFTLPQIIPERNSMGDDLFREWDAALCSNQFS